MEAIKWIVANWDFLISVGIGIGLLIAWWNGKITTQQLLAVIDAEPKVSNKDFQARAEVLGKAIAAKAIAKIK